MDEEKEVPEEPIQEEQIETPPETEEVEPKPDPPKPDITAVSNEEFEAEVLRRYPHLRQAPQPTKEEEPSFALPPEWDWMDEEKKEEWRITQAEERALKRFESKYGDDFRHSALTSIQQHAQSLPDEARPYFDEAIRSLGPNVRDVVKQPGAIEYLGDAALGKAFREGKLTAPPRKRTAPRAEGISPAPQERDAGYESYKKIVEEVNASYGIKMDVDKVLREG